MLHPVLAEEPVGQAREGLARTLAILNKIPVGQRAWYMAFTPDERFLYVACGRSDAVSVIDVATDKVVATVPVGKMPFAVAIQK